MGSSFQCSTEGLDQQAKDYARLFAIFVKHKNLIERVTFWGLNDCGRSKQPIEGRGASATSVTSTDMVRVW